MAHFGRPPDDDDRVGTGPQQTGYTITDHTGIEPVDFALLELFANEIRTQLHNDFQKCGMCVTIYLSLRDRLVGSGPYSAPKGK